MGAKDLLMDMVNDHDNRYLRIERGEERQAVLTVDDQIKLSPEAEHVIEKRPEVHRIESAPANDLDTVDCLISCVLAVVATKDGHVDTSGNPAFGDLMDIDFRPSCPDVAPVAPVED